MDSVSQLALGASISVAVIGNKTSIWKAAVVGAICGTLPDLDILIRNADEIKNITNHRALTHSLLYLTLLATPLVTWRVVKLFHQPQYWRSWALAVWLALITHPLQDIMTIYGTQLGIPFTNHPFAIGSVFIIDPAYTVWLILGLIFAFRLRGRYGLIANAAGLILSTSYLGWSIFAQQLVLEQAREMLVQQHVVTSKIMATPTPFNTIIWRIVALQPNGDYAQGYYSLLTPKQSINFTFHSIDNALYGKVQHNWHVERMSWFTQGFFKIGEQDHHLIITDLRMGAEPCYAFQFDIGKTDDLMAQTNEKQNFAQYNAKPLMQNQFCIDRMLQIKPDIVNNITIR